MADPFLGEIRMFGGNFAPLNWALCEGQILQISQNTALFSLLGTYYGGDGIRTFALPDLRGRAAVNQGQGPGLSNYVVGEMRGQEMVTLMQTNLPPHTHSVNCDGSASGQASPAGHFPGSVGTATERPYSTASNTTMAPNMIGVTGGGQPVSIVQPVLCVSFIIALAGIYPSRG